MDARLKPLTREECISSFMGLMAFDPTRPSNAATERPQTASRCTAWSRDLRIVLRRFPPIEHPIVTHDSDAAEPRVLWQIEPVLECFRVSPRLPGREKDEIARRQNRIENIPCDQPPALGSRPRYLEQFAAFCVSAH